MKTNPETLFEKRNRLKIIFMKKLFLTGFIQTFIIGINYLFLLQSNTRIDLDIAATLALSFLISLFSLVAFKCFKFMSKYHGKFILLFLVTVSELISCISGKGRFSPREKAISYVILFVFGSISAIYLIFLIYSLFIKRKFVWWIPLLCCFIVLSAMFIPMIISLNRYQVELGATYGAMLAFLLYALMRFMYITQKFGKGYSGGAYYLLVAKLITDALHPLMLAVLVAGLTVNCCNDCFDCGCDCDCLDADSGNGTGLKQGQGIDCPECDCAFDYESGGACCEKNENLFDCIDCF